MSKQWNQLSQNAKIAVAVAGTAVVAGAAYFLWKRFSCNDSKACSKGSGSAAPAAAPTPYSAPAPVVATPAPAPAAPASAASSSSSAGRHTTGAGPTRVKTPFGYGYIDQKQPYTETGLYRVHLPNKTMGYLNPESVQKLPADEPVYVRTPFGLGELVEPVQTTADLQSSAGGLYKVRLPGALATINDESLRIANFDPYPSVETPDGPGRVLEPTQDGPKLQPNPNNYKFTVQLDSGAVRVYSAYDVSRMQRGHTLEN